MGLVAAHASVTPGLRTHRDVAALQQRRRLPADVNAVVAAAPDLAAHHHRLAALAAPTAWLLPLLVLDHAARPAEAAAAGLALALVLPATAAAAAAFCCDQQRLAEAHHVHIQVLQHARPAAGQGRLLPPPRASSSRQVVNAQAAPPSLPPADPEHRHVGLVVNDR